jgi:hypothetical protein
VSIVRLGWRIGLFPHYRAGMDGRSAVTGGTHAMPHPVPSAGLIFASKARKTRG